MAASNCVAEGRQLLSGEIEPCDVYLPFSASDPVAAICDTICRTRIQKWHLKGVLGQAQTHPATEILESVPFAEVFLNFV